MVNIVGNLSDSDLGRWRKVTARYELVQLNHPGISPTEAENYIIDYNRMLGEFFITYALSEERTDAYYISANTGHICDDGG